MNMIKKIHIIIMIFVLSSFAGRVAGQCVDVGPAMAAICQGGTSAALGGALLDGTTSAIWSDGAANGTFSNNGGSTPGIATYTAAANSTSPVTLTLTGSGGTCSPVSAQKTIVVNPTPNAAISYSGTPYCTSLASAQSVTRTGTAGGTYTALPAGLTINSGTGAITPSSSTEGTYIVTYTIAAGGGCPQVTATTSVIITAAPVAGTISYAGAQFCTSIITPQPVTRTGDAGGTYTASPSGLTIDPSTGAITPSTSTAKAYTVTYTIAAGGGCAQVTATTSVTITTGPSALISYFGTPFCTSISSPQAVSRTGNAGGTYTASPAGLTISSSTGAITPSTSAEGTYTVTYTIAASGSCPQFTTTTSVTITTAPVAGTISYAGSPFCTSLSTPQAVSSTGDIGGNYTASPAGLTINSSSGAITPGTSTAGLYTVTYTIPGGGGCSQVTATTSVTITTAPAATISYAGTPFCTSIATPQSVTRTGTTGGTYTASPGGLTMNSSTGAITPSTSAEGTYTVTYTIVAGGGCAQVTATASVTIMSLSVAGTISYPGTPFCTSVATPQAVTSTGDIGGTYTATPAGLTLNASSGAITPGTSTAGNYTVTYTIAASGACPQVSTTTLVTITAAPVAGTISYAGTPFCASVSTPQPVTRTGTTGGIYTASPGGLTIDALSGAITPGTSTAGTYTITYTIAASGGCSQVTVTTLVTITPNVGTPVFTLGATSARCQGAGTITYTATAANTTGITYSLDVASLLGGNSIVATTGAVTYVAGWSGISIITASAAGCSGPLSATHSVATAPTVGIPSIPAPSTTSICEGSTNTSYTTSASSAVSYTWSVTGTGNTISGTGPTGTVTWAPDFFGTSVVGVIAEGCGGPSVAVSTTVTVRPRPTATISGTISVCQNAVSPNVTFTNPQSLPIVVTYNINGTNQTTIAVAANTFATVAAPTTISGTFAYNLVSVDYQTAPTCTNIVSGSAFITVNSSPTATLTRTNPDSFICLGTSVTFTAGGGTNYNFRVQGTTVQNGTGNTYTTTTLGNGQVVSVIVSNTTGCAAAPIGITNFVNPLPFIFVSTPASCSADLTTYSLAVTVNTGTVTSTSGTVTNTGGNVWSIAGVHSGTNIVISVTDFNGCLNTIDVTAPNCSCPVVLPPVSGGNRSYCASGTIPTISATVLAGETVDWYSAASGGSLLRSGNLSYTPPSAGTYYAIARNIITGCVSSTRTAISITMNALPVPTLVSSDPDNSFCAGTSVTFTAGGGTNFNFRVAGVSVQNGTSTTFTTTTLTNNQIVDVIVTSSEGCSTTSAGITNTVNIVPAPNAGTGGTECDLNFKFSAVPGVGVGTWTLTSGPGTGSFAPNANTATATVTVSAYGTYTFTWTEVNAGCSTSAPINVTFTRPPVANPGAGGNNCGTEARLNAVPSIGTGTWTRTAGPGTAIFTPNANTPTPTVTVSAFGQYTFTWTEVNGICSNSAPVIISFIRIPAANAGPDGSVCALNYTLNAIPGTGAGTGVWSKVSGPGNATFSPDRNQPGAKVTVDQYGEYEFSWTEVNSTCQSTDVVKIIFHNFPSVNAGRDTVICKGGSVQLAAVGSGSFQWDPGTLADNPNIFNPVVNPLTTTVFEATLTDQFGCKNSDMVTVNVMENPVANAGPDQILDYMFETTMDAVLANSFETGIWSLISGAGKIFDPASPTTGISGLSPGLNKFLWTVTNKVCPASSDSVTITVNDFVIPTLITPNMDGKNDYFVLKGLSTLGKTQLIIFDRRGAKVYQNLDYDNSWNGVDYNGKPLPDDTYFYVLKSNNGKSKSGYVVIRR